MLLRGQYRGCGIREFAGMGGMQMPSATGEHRLDASLILVPLERIGLPDERKTGPLKPCVRALMRLLPNNNTPWKVSVER